MSEDDQSIVDVTLGEVADSFQLRLTGHHVAIRWTTEQRVNDVFGRRVLVSHQQMLTGDCGRRACNNSLVYVQQ